jgi:hypothetical protein
MHVHFADWYREANLAPTAEVLSLREAGVVKVATSLEVSQIPELVRILLSLPARNMEYRTQFAATFREADSAFGSRNNERELAVLAGVTIAEVLAKRGEIACATALAVLCASFSGGRTEPPVVDILGEAKEHLAAASRGLRADIALPSIAHEALAVDELITQVKKACEANTLPQVQPALPEALGKITAGVNRLGMATSDLAQKCDACLRVLAEESNILWWVFGAYSRALDKPFRDLDTAVASCIAGTELADLVVLPPGPASAHAFLDRAIRNSRDGMPQSVTVFDAISRSPREWRAKVVAGIDSLQLEEVCPILLAAKASLAVDEGSDWLPVFRKTCSADLKKNVSPLAIAVQAFQESLLARELRTTERSHA